MLGIALPLVAVAAALAFGAVYPWGSVPLWGGAALLGLFGFVKGSRQLPLFTAAAALVVVAIAIQLIPIPAPWLARLSPNTPRVLEQFSLAFAGGLETDHPLSIDAGATRVALFALVSFLVYLIGASALLRTHDVMRLPVTLMLVAVPMAFFGIFSRQFGNGNVYGVWPSREGGVDIAGPFINRNHFSGWMMMATLTCLGWLIGQLDAVRRTSHGGGGRFAWLDSSHTSRIVTSGAAIACMAVGLVWPMSRSSIVGFLTGLAVLALMVSGRPRFASRMRIAIVASLAVLIGFAVSLRGITRLAEWFSDIPHFQGRIAAWLDAWRVFTDFPLVGTGVNTFGAAMLFYQRSNTEKHLSSAHNDYLQILSDGGLLVGIPAALAIAAFGLALRRRLVGARVDARSYWIRAGAVAAIASVSVQEIFEFSLQIPANAFLFCTLAAVALAPIKLLHGAHQVEVYPLACQKCRSTDVVRSRTRNHWEVWRREVTRRRPYRCRGCGWRWWSNETALRPGPPDRRAPGPSARDLTDA